MASREQVWVSTRSSNISGYAMDRSRSWIVPGYIWSRNGGWWDGYDVRYSSSRWHWSRAISWRSNRLWLVDRCSSKMGSCRSRVISWYLWTRNGWKWSCNRRRHPSCSRGRCRVVTRSLNWISVVGSCDVEMDCKWRRPISWCLWAYNRRRWIGQSWRYPSITVGRIWIILVRACCIWMVENRDLISKYISKLSCRSVKILYIYLKIHTKI